MSLTLESSTNKARPVLARLRSAMLEALGAIFWTYAVATVFIVDLDSPIKAQLGEYGSLVTYKSLIFLGILVLVSWTTSLLGMIKGISFVLFWPAIKIVWNLPKILIRIGSWSLALGIIGALTSLFYNFRQNTTLLFCLSICQIAPFLIVNSNLLALFAALNLVVLVWMYVRATLAIFRPNILLAGYSYIIEKSTGFVVTHTKLDDEIKQTPIKKLGESQITKRSENLSQALLFGRACAFAARKLPALHSKGYATVAGAMSVLLLVSLVVLVFTSVNFSIYRANPASFEIVGDPSYFKFAYYSFSNFLNRDIKDVVATSGLAQAASVLESIFALFIALIFAASLVSFKTEKYLTQLNETANSFELQSKAIEAHIASEWNLSETEAFEELERVKSGALAILIWLTKNTR